MIIRSAVCTKCNERLSTKSKYKWAAELKYYIKLYKHYKKMHKVNILMEVFLKNKYKNNKIVNSYIHGFDDK